MSNNKKNSPYHFNKLIPTIILITSLIAAPVLKAQTNVSIHISSDTHQTILDRPNIEKGGVKVNRSNDTLFTAANIKAPLNGQNLGSLIPNPHTVRGFMFWNRLTFSTMESGWKSFTLNPFTGVSPSIIDGMIYDVISGTNYLGVSYVFSGTYDGPFNAYSYNESNPFSMTLAGQLRDQSHYYRGTMLNNVGRRILVALGAGGTIEVRYDVLDDWGEQSWKKWDIAYFFNYTNEYTGGDILDCYGEGVVWAGRKNEFVALKIDVDVTNIGFASHQVLGTYSLDGDVSQIIKYQDLLYILLYNGKLAIFDVTNPTPVFEKYIDIPSLSNTGALNIHYSSSFGTLLQIGGEASNSCGLAIFTLNDPHNPTFVNFDGGELLHYPVYSIVTPTYSDDVYIACLNDVRAFQLIQNIVEYNPDIDVSSTELNFGDVILSKDLILNLAVNNLGNDDLTVSTTDIIGPNSEQFSFVSGQGSFTIPSGGSAHSIPIKFSPTAEGSKSATLRITSNDPDENPLDVALTGNGAPEPVADIAVSPSSKNYGDVQIGSSSSETFVVTNDGTANLCVISVSLAGTNSNQFNIVSGGSSFTVVSEATHDVVVSFNPNTEGVKNATLQFVSNDPDEDSLNVALNGNGVPDPVADIAVSPSSKNYGEVQIGSSSSETFIVTNDGTANLDVSSVSLAGTNSDQFSIVSGGGSFTVAPGATHDFLVKFNPTTEGTNSATFRFASNDPDENPLDVALSGNGVSQPVADIAVSPSSKNYGDIQIGSSSSETFIVTNDGTANLDVSSVSLAGTNSNQFSIVSGGGSFSVAPGASHDVVVSFNPNTEDVKNATLQFASNDPDENPLDVALSGNGVSQPVPDIAASTTELNFGDVFISNFSILNINIFNNGTADLNVSATNIIGIDASQFSFISGNGNFSIISGGNARSIEIKFSPISEGAKSATLRITSNDPDNNLLDIPLNGVGMIDNTAAYFDDPTIVNSPMLNNDFTFEVYIVDNETEIQSVKLYFREGGKSVYDELSFILGLSTENRWTVTIPANKISEQGLEYYIEAIHGGATTTYPANLSNGPEIISVNVPLMAFPQTTLLNAYQMISIPMNANNKKISDILMDDLGGYDSTQYRIFDWDQSNEKYIELYALSAELSPGKALWLITKENKNLDIENSESVDTGENYPIQLKQGWNMIGVPFAFTVAWSDVDASDILGGTLNFCNGTGWESALNMEPFKGYAVKAVTDATLYIPPHEAGIPGKLKMSFQLSEGEWQVQLKATRHKYEDLFNFAGVRSTAMNKWDMLDSAEPPSIGNFISIYFDHSDWENNKGRYNCDFREPSAEGYIFDFTTESNLESYTNLNFVPQNLPENFDWVVVSPKTHVKYPKGEISTPFSKQKYRLLVGTVSFINEALSSFKEIPTNFELMQNFPNPFNPQTTIRYGLPKAEKVTLKVYNLLGKEVVTLVKDELKAEGYHKTIWDGRDQEGRVVTSGLYLYQLRSGNFSIIKRMVVIK